MLVPPQGVEFELLFDNVIEGLLDQVVCFQQPHNHGVDQSVVVLAGVEHQPIQRAWQSHSQDHLDPPAIALGAVNLVVVMVVVLVLAVVAVVLALIATRVVVWLTCLQPSGETTRTSAACCYAVISSDAIASAC